jgi:excisionase family DNA binding protein
MEETMTTFEQLPEMMAILLKKVESLETSISEIKDNIKHYDRLLDVEEASELLKKSVSTIYRMTHEKDIPHIKQGNRVYFKESELYEWLDKNRREDNHTTLADIEEMMSTQAAAYARKKK